LSEEYGVLGGIFSNGLLALKFSKELENIVRDVRKNFGKTHLKLLTQVVEYDCKKRVDKPQKFATTNGTIPSQNEKKYAFHGDGHCLSFEEVRAVIKESISRKNIQPKRAQAITRKIMKRMKLKRAHQVKEYTYQWR